MDWKSKVNWIVLLAIICFAAFGIARTAYFDNKTDAVNALGSQIGPVAGDCKILSIEETIEEGKEGESTITATYSMEFTRNGVSDRRIGQVALASATQKNAEDLTAPACEATWQAIRGEYTTIDTAVVEYQKGALATVLDRVYSVTKDSWTSISAIEP